MALELDTDYETLEAAFKLIDEWELEIDALASSSDKSPPDDCDARSTTTTASTEDSDDAKGSSSPPPPPPPSISSTVENMRRRKLRSEEADSIVPTQMGRREELVFLRRRVRELEGVLTAIKDDKDEGLTCESSIDAVEHQQRAHELDASWVWQQIAVRQLEHRQKSERENLRLRVQAEEQIKFAKDLMRVLLRAYNQEEVSKEDCVARSFKRSKGQHDTLTQITEEEQLRHVDDMMDESSALFAALPFTGGLPVFRDVNVLEHKNGETTINVDSSWVVPFPVPQVMTAFWVHLMQKTRGNHDCELALQHPALQPDNGRELLVTRYESNATASKFAGKFFGRFVARRKHPDGETPGVIIMDMSADPVGFKPMSMEGVRLHTQTLIRVVWADQAAGSSSNTTTTDTTTGRMSLIQMSQRLHVNLAAAETPTRRRRVGALTNFLMYNVEAELDWKQDLLETLLMRSVEPSSR